MPIITHNDLLLHTNNINKNAVPQIWSIRILCLIDIYTKRFQVMLRYVYALSST